MGRHEDEATPEPAVPAREPGVFIGIRDIYDALHRLEAATNQKMADHEHADAERFANLNLKFYGILTGALAAAGAVIAGVLRGM